MSTVVEFTAPWIVAFQDGEHRLLRNGAVVVENDTIVHVGKPGEVHSDRTEPTNNIIAPGFISLHTHMHESPIDKGIAEDTDKRQFWSTNLIEILPPRSKALSVDDMHACTRVSIAEHLRTGSTTVMQMGAESNYVAQMCEEVGLRAFIGESYRSGEWFTPNGRTVDYRWFDDDGRQAFEDALEFALQRRNASGNALVTGFLNPSQVDTCSEDLLQRTRTAAEEHDLLIQIHAAQSYSEFHEMTRRHGKTPIEWLNDIGFLSDRTLIGHGLFLSNTSWTNFYGDDLGLLSRSGTTVVYNPWVFARNGIIMESYDSYQDRGVNVCLGTDTTTQSMLLSMRWASIITKVFEHRADVGTARDVFNAATVRAADVLRRPDLGRIETGAKADLVFWNTDSLTMLPDRDPIRTIVYYAEHSDIERVMVGGRFSLENGSIRSLDEAADRRTLQQVAERMWEGWPKHDWSNRSMDEHVPLSYAAFELRDDGGSLR